MKAQEIEQARALIVEEKKARTAACWAEIEQVLERHRCELRAEPVFVAGEHGHVVRAQVWVSARED